MARFRRKPVRVEAVQLRWDKLTEVCELVGLTLVESAGCYVDAEGRITNDSNARIGLKLFGGAVAAQDDWIVRMPDCKLGVYKPDAFEALFESHADYKTEFDVEWSKYPKLAGALQEEEDRELRELLVEARADAVQYVSDVKREELEAARADERRKLDDVHRALRRITDEIVQVFGSQEGWEAAHAAAARVSGR